MVSVLLLFVTWYLVGLIVIKTHEVNLTCADVMKNVFSRQSAIELRDGEYKISLKNTSESNYTVFCSFDYLNNYAWTLIESGSFLSYSRHYDSLLTYGFITDVSYNEESPDANKETVFRMSKNTMISIKNNSQFLFATCNFDLTMENEFWLMRLDKMEKDPWYETLDGTCITSVGVNIRGYKCNNTDVPTWSNASPYHFHIQSSTSGCSCSPWSSDAVSSEDNFAYYNGRNTNHACSATHNSTANWWLGSHLGMH